MSDRCVVAQLVTVCGLLLLGACCAEYARDGARSGHAFRRSGDARGDVGGDTRKRCHVRCAVGPRCSERLDPGKNFLAVAEALLRSKLTYLTRTVSAW